MYLPDTHSHTQLAVRTTRVTQFSWRRRCTRWVEDTPEWAGATWRLGRTEAKAGAVAGTGAGAAQNPGCLVGLSTQPNSFAACINNSQFHLELYAICDGFRLSSVLFAAQLPRSAASTRFHFILSLLPVQWG